MATIPLGLYLWHRIHQLGISHIFGVPGDFNLTLLDHIYSVPGLDWIGSANELNAAYSADGYARIARAGCLVTTHGVGELSALNGVAGALSERVPVVHVVGQTPRAAQRARLPLHHAVSAQRPDHAVFARAAADFRVAAAHLNHAKSAPAEIDRVLRECVVKSGPVCIYLPCDLVGVGVPAAPLEVPLDLEAEVDEEPLKEAVEAVAEALYTSANPCVLVDGLTASYRAEALAREFVRKTRLPVYTTLMGKGVVDESESNFVGLYNGTTSEIAVSKAFEACDTVILLGDVPCDTNTAGFTRNIKKEKCVHVNPFDVTIGGTRTINVPMKPLLKQLTANINLDRLPASQISTSLLKLPRFPAEPDHIITQDWIWPFLTHSFLREDDILIGETGTASFGLPANQFPDRVKWVAQTFYGSIGYATPATLGADLARAARPAPVGRTVLVTGDGSLLLTLQEIGTMVRYGVAPVIFVINNAGYTLERVIHGAHRSYNDIPALDYAALLPLFGVPAASARANFHRATTPQQLREIVALDRVRCPVELQVVEVVLDKLDVPWQVASMIGAIKGPEAVKEMEEAGFKVVDPRVREVV